MLMVGRVMAVEKNNLLLTGSSCVTCSHSCILGLFSTVLGARGRGGHTGFLKHHFIEKAA